MYGFIFFHGINKSIIEFISENSRKKNRIYLFGQQQAQSNCILYYKRPLQLLYYFLWEILWKGKIAPENFSVKLLCIFVGFFVFIKIDPALCAKSRAKRLFSMRKKGSPREPSNLINSRRDIGFAPSKLCP